MMIFASIKPTKDKNTKEKILPLGHFSQKHHIIWNIIFVGMIVFAILLSYIFTDLLQLDTVTSFILIFICLFIFVYRISILTNPAVRALFKFNKELSFIEYERSMLELINVKNLHEDSKSYLMLLYVNYLYLYDLDVAIEYFKNINIPNHKAYKLQFHLIDTINSINKKDHEEALNKLELFKKLYPKNRNIGMLEMAITVNCTSNEIPNIKELYPIDKGMNIQRFFDLILYDLNSLKDLIIEEILFEKIAQKACKSAIKSGDKISNDETNIILEQIKCNFGLKCPHGRPIAVKITRNEIDKWFKRIV
jgi:tetratricopeptide (TPR) repeat protein